jgi:hypothetical protein
MPQDPKQAKNAAHGSAVRPCGCSHQYQNTVYGRGMRVHTLGGTKDRTVYTCTVCGRRA